MKSLQNTITAWLEVQIKAEQNVGFSDINYQNLGFKNRLGKDLMSDNILNFIEQRK